MVLLSFSSLMLYTELHQILNVKLNPYSWNKCYLVVRFFFNALLDQCIFHFGFLKSTFMRLVCIFPFLCCPCMILISSCKSLPKEPEKHFSFLEQSASCNIWVTCKTLCLVHPKQIEFFFCLLLQRSPKYYRYLYNKPQPIHPPASTINSLPIIFHLFPQSLPLPTPLEGMILKQIPDIKSSYLGTFSYLS